MKRGYNIKYIWESDWKKFKDAHFKFKNSTNEWGNPFGKNVSKKIVDILEVRE